MKTLLSITLAAVTVLTGCSLKAKQALLTEDFRIEKVEIPFLLTKVNVVDRRTNVSTRDIKIPAVSMTQKRDEVSPQLTEAQKNLIQSELVQYFTGSNQSVIANVEILRAQQQFETNWQGERESAITEVKVTLTDVVSKQLIGYATGEATLFVQSIDASADYITKLYEKALKVSLYQAARYLDRALW